MLILEHMKRLVDACYPKDEKDAAQLWDEIKPIKFGDRHLWVTSASNQILASYTVPEDAAYLVILRTECYTTTFIAAAPGFGQFSPPPGGTVQWLANTGAGTTPITGQVPIHLLADVDEFIMVKSGLLISLEGVLDAIPDANARFIRTTVYAYHLGANIADRIGSGEATAFGQNT